jgi:hypothetical protein
VTVRLKGRGKMFLDSLVCIYQTTQHHVPEDKDLFYSMATTVQQLALFPTKILKRNSPLHNPLVLWFQKNHTLVKYSNGIK